MPKPKTITLIDDHDIVRKGLKQLIESMGNYKVIDEYHNGLAFVKSLPELKTLPDIFILDYSMPMLNGVETLKEALAVNKDLKFLVLTQHLEEDIIDSVYENGARGFLHKNCSSEELRLTVDNIINIGYSNISEILKRIRHITNKKELPKPDFSLSERELQLMELVCDEKEYTYQQIADIMNVSIKSVDKYRGLLFSKLNVKSKVGMVLFSFKHRLTKPFIED